ncbi:MAG: D-glycero-beta-D-manno-heptose-7-phosphate kinase [Candidatus Cloacimonetes bacterium]|nr:D-glycero-beta-D-manno-heptose-7-phosphate kinase [Candidatus Cloacimonadota bacterium]
MTDPDLARKLSCITELFKSKHILVVGDMILDHYIDGKVQRISPEAPIPIVEVSKEYYRLGGAANVANNLVSLGIRTSIAGMLGGDRYAGIFRDKLSEKGISPVFLIEDTQRSTTLKTRIMSNNHHIVRVDFEHKHYAEENNETLLLQNISSIIQNVDAVILQDYNKGVLTPRIINETIQLCRLRNVPVLVDPKFTNFFAYTGCTVFKPNMKELQQNLSLEINTDAELTQAARQLNNRLDSDYLVITRGAEGITVFEKELRTDYPSLAREVYDVSGAGDTVISILAASLAVGLDIKNAVECANIAAGLVCAKAGTKPVEATEFQKAVIRFHSNHIDA